MDLSTFKQIRNEVAFGIGIITAIGVVMNSFLIPLVGISIGMIVIYLTKQRVMEIDRDERTTLVSQKASTATLSMSTAAMAFTGLALIILSRQGLADFEQLGYTLNILAFMMMGLRSYFDWHYKNKLGG
jgi:uncharacterized membrane protein